MSRVLRLQASIYKIAALVWAVSSTTAFGQSACEVYTVRQGDTLSSIAVAARVPGGFQVLFSANRDIVQDPTALQIGMQLRIPCADGTLPGVQTASAATASPTSPQTGGALTGARFLTGGNFAPFTDENSADLGMFSELVVAALQNVEPDFDHNIIFINDWDSHLSALLPSGAFDMGFPWHLPDCSDISQLSPANAVRCTDYDASKPFFEAIIGFYSKTGSSYASAQSLEDLSGARICRPEGWFTFDLEAAGLVDQLTMGRIANTCWQALQDDKVDIVSYDAFTAEEDIVTLELGSEVTAIEDLNSVATMHVLTPKSNPNGQAYLDMLNAGLDQMRANGQWFAIVSKHLSAHRQRVGTRN